MTPRTTLPARRGEATRKCILDAAYAVFVRCGYGGTSVDEIIAEADISKGALYHHFSGKQEIFQAILSAYVRRCAEQMTAAIDPNGTIGTNIEHILRASWDEVQADPAWPALQMEFWVHATRDEHARSVVANSYGECRGLIAGLVASLQAAGMLRRELDPQVAARLFMAINDGILLQWQIEPDVVAPSVMLAPMAAMIAAYLAPTEGTDIR